MTYSTATDTDGGFDVGNKYPTVLEFLIMRVFGNADMANVGDSILDVLFRPYCTPSTET
jgi:hypothetical protein